MEGLEIHRNFRWILLASWEPSQKRLRSRRNIFKEVWNFWRYLTEIYWKMQDIQDLPSNCHQAARSMKAAFKFRAFGQEKYQSFRLFWSNSLYKIDVLHNVSWNLSKISPSGPKVYTPLEDNTRFLQQFFPFTLFPLPTPLALTLFEEITWQGNVQGNFKRF